MLAIFAVGAIAAVIPTVASASSGGQFKVNCDYSHSLPDDPIVYPGQPGASHLHDFFGNTTTDADSTAATLLAGGTTCGTTDDKSGYWEPALYFHQVKQHAIKVAVYYVGNGTTGPVPAGLQMVAGDAHAAGIQPASIMNWSCGDGTPNALTPYNCKPYIAQHPFGVQALVKFPTCWDAKGLSRSDVVYKVRGACPEGYRNAIPQIRVFLKTGIVNPFNASGGIAISFASGPFYTLHADFFNAWNQARMESLTQNCIDAGKNCGAIN